MKTRILSLDELGCVEKASRNYASQERAELAVYSRLKKVECYRDVMATIAVQRRSDGRFVPLTIFQGGPDAVQACIDFAREGFPSFA